MNGRKFINKIMTGLWLTCAMALVHAETPVWTFTPINRNNTHGRGERHRHHELSSHQSIHKDTYISQNGTAFPMKHSWRKTNNYVRELPNPLCFRLPAILYFEFIH